MSPHLDSHVRPRLRRSPLPFEAVAATHLGHRDTNADAHLIDEVAGFFAVSDGMGDTPRSGLIARMALESAGELFLGSWPSSSPSERVVHEAVERLRLGIAQAHGRLYVPGRPREQRVGATFAGMVACAGWICFAHVGDSRVYLLRRSKARLACLTDDHTVLGDALRRGVAREVALTHPDAHAVTRMLGVTTHVEAEPLIQRWEPGDVVMLCTDGVSDRVDTEELAVILLDTEHLGEAADRVVARSIDTGGKDNATAVLVRRLR